MLKALGIFLLAVAYCAALISWSSFADPDAFYHAKVSLLLWQNGPLLAFPWLDLTSLKVSFADHHFLFHVIEAPFMHIWGLYDGTRIVSVLLAAGFLLTSFLVLRWMRLPYAWAWTLLLAISSPLMVRLLLGKASPLALILFLLGMTAAWKRRPFLVFIVTTLFALSHGGWMMLIGSLVLLAIGDATYRVVIENRSKRSSFFTAPLREIIAAILGVGFGTMLHPNFPENLFFLWIQVVKIGLGTPFNHVILGSEWLPVNPGWLVGGIALWLIALGVGMFGVFSSHRRTLDSEAARASIAFALPVAAFLALTLKSRRSVEYLIPALVLWIPWLWRMVDTKILVSRFREAIPAKLQFLTIGVICLVFLGLAGNYVRTAYVGLHAGRYPDNVFQEAFAPISARANAGDRVFHSDWDEFPVLFSLDDRLRYIAGLDPTFLYEASPELSDEYRDVTWGAGSTSTTAIWSFVHDRVQARFIFIDKRDHPALLKTIKSDSRYELLKESEDGASFEVNPNEVAKH